MNILAPEKNQFAGHGVTDHAAVCVTCRKHHLIAKGEQIGAQAWLDWLAKHPAPHHETFIVPYSVLTSVNALMQRLTENADAKVAYGASAAYTWTLTGLATDASLLAGRESTWVSNASNKYIDELIAGFITTGTSPTAAKQIEVYAIGSLNDTPLYPDVFDGTDSAETITSADIKSAICKLLALLTTSNTSDRTYPFGPAGIRQLFGDGLPTTHGLFGTHNTAVNLNATAANHAAYHTPVYATLT